MPQTLSPQNEADARAQLLNVVEHTGVELIQIVGVARNQLKPIPADLLDDLLVAILCAHHVVLRYRQQHELETTPQREPESEPQA
jgi:hypothetical protein